MSAAPARKPIVHFVGSIPLPDAGQRRSVAPVLERSCRRPTNTIERPVGEPDRHIAPLGDLEKRV